MGHNFTKNVIHIVSSDLRKWIGAAVFNGWCCLVWIFQSFSPPLVNQRDRWPWTNQRQCCHCIATCHLLNDAPTFYRAPWMVSRSSRAPALDVTIGRSAIKRYGDVAHLSRATGHVYERKFDESVNVMQSVLIQRRRSKNFRQVRFFLINAIFFFIKPDFPNPHFTPLSWLDVHFINSGIQVCY